MTLSEVDIKKNSGEKVRLLYVVSEDWYFASHRLDLATAALSAGWDVSVTCRASNSVPTITSAGITFRDWNFPRGSLNPGKLLLAILTLRKNVRELDPSHIHAVSILTVVIARMALLGFRDIVFISTVAGLGRLSAGGKLLTAIKNKALATLGSWLAHPKGSRLVAQNIDDYRALGGAKNESVLLITGSGVDPERFPKTAVKQKKDFSVLLAARMIRDKGIKEFVLAMEILRSEGLSVVGYLVGNSDSGNPRSLSFQEISNLTTGSPVAWLGHRDDVFELLVDSDVVCLPTYYGEGIPRVLLEAGCVGRTVVTCDVSGPRDLVRHGVDGLLVAPRDPLSLADALRKLNANRLLLQQMAESLHVRVTENYANNVILSQYLKLYRRG